jgi:hypothetical protein
MPEGSDRPVGEGRRNGSSPASPRTTEELVKEELRSSAEKRESSELLEILRIGFRNEYERKPLDHPRPPGPLPLANAIGPENPAEVNVHREHLAKAKRALVRAVDSLNYGVDKLQIRDEWNAAHRKGKWNTLEILCSGADCAYPIEPAEDECMRCGAPAARAS